MSTPHGYILDTNVFIEAARRYYALDIAPGFWNALIKHAGYGRIISIDMVKDEIDKGNDALKIWINSHFQRWFESTVQEDVTKSYSVVIAWAQSQTQYSPAAKADFAGCPDGWIIAYALAKKLVQAGTQPRGRRERTPNWSYFLLTFISSRLIFYLCPSLSCGYTRSFRS